MLYKHEDFFNIKEKLGLSEDELNKIISSIDEALNHSVPVLIAIEGRCCSGKTTLANELSNLYKGSQVYHTDDYFLPPSRKSTSRLNEKGGNIDYEGLADLITKIKSYKPFEYKKYNCHTDEYTTCLGVPSQVNIIEGVYSMHPTLIANYDVKIYLDVDKTTQIQRLKTRCNNNTTLYNQFVNEWLKYEDNYFGVNK